MTVTAALAALAAAGCSGKMFRPVTVHAAADADVTADVQGLYVTRFPGSTVDEDAGLRFDLEVDQRALARVGEVRLTSARQPPCSSGLKAKSTTWAGDPGSSRRHLEVAFSRPAAIASGVFADQSATLDVAVFSADKSVAGRCLRIPLVEARDPRAGQWVHDPLLMGGEERVMIFSSPIPGLRNPGLLLGAGLGGWSGRWSWMLEGEGGFTGRADTATGESGMGRLYTLWGGSASLRTLVVNHGRFGVGAIAGYEVLRASPSGPASPEPPPAKLTLHGPRIGVRLLYLVDPLQWPRFRSPLDAFGGGVTIYGGVWGDGWGFRSPSPFFAVALEGNLGF